MIKPPHLTVSPLPRTLNGIMEATAGKKILIVEDEQDIAQLVQHYLQKDGFRSVTAINGVEALKKVKAEQPDLIVLDLMLPEMDGL